MTGDVDAERFVQQSTGECDDQNRLGPLWCLTHESKWPRTADCCNFVADMADMCERFAEAQEREKDG